MSDPDLPDNHGVPVKIDDAQKSARLAIAKFLRPIMTVPHPSLTKPEAGHVEDFRARVPDDNAAGSLNDVFADGAQPIEKENVTPIYDVSGRLLFRDFTARRSDGTEIRVRTAADKLLGAPVFSVGTNAAFPVYEALDRAKEAAQQRGLTPVELPEGAICYSYPKLGLLCRDTKGRRSAVDILDLSIQPIDNAPEGAGDPELVRATSLLHAIAPSMIDAQLNRFEGFQSALSPLSNATAPEGGQSTGTVTKQRIVEEVDCIAQENRTWCAVAAAKMILDFYGFVHKQSEIAVIMNTGPDGTPSEPNQVDGYKKLSESALIASYDESATFAKAQSEINAGRPLKSGIAGHARTVVGWKGDPTGGDDGAWLYIFDPWQGAKVWEKWGAVEILNFIYVRRSQTS